MNILIIRFSSLGDLVTLEPTFRALRHFHRNDRITFVTSQVGKELYEDTGYFDRIVVESGSRHGQLLHRARALRNELGNSRFDIVYHLQTSRFSHLLTLLLRKDRVVHIAASLWQKLFSIKASFRPPGELLRLAGHSESAIREYLGIEQNNQVALGVDARLVNEYRSNLGDTRQIIALAPGASPRWESKKWGDEHFAALAKLIQETGARVIVIGSAQEAPAARLIQAGANATVDYTGRTSIGQLKALLSISTVMIGNDSGPAHIAAAVGTTTVTLFASTSDIHCVKNMAYRGNHICISADSGTCKTCYDPCCVKSRECMATISPAKVFQAVLELAQEQ